LPRLPGVVDAVEARGSRDARETHGPRVGRGQQRAARMHTRQHAAHIAGQRLGVRRWQLAGEQ
jgi:hypothetical protein